MKRRSGFLWFLLAAFLFAAMVGGCGGGGGGDGDGGNPGAPGNPGGGGSGNLAGVWYMTGGSGTWIRPGQPNEYISLHNGTWNVDANYSISCSLEGELWWTPLPGESSRWVWSAQNYTIDANGIAIYMTSNKEASTIRVEVFVQDESATKVTVRETINMNDGSTVDLFYHLTKQP